MPLFGSKITMRPSGNASDAPITFTTVGNWRQSWRSVAYLGEQYTWSKHEEFLKFLDVPKRAQAPFELALASLDGAARRLLELAGHQE